MTAAVELHDADDECSCGILYYPVVLCYQGLPAILRRAPCELVQHGSVLLLPLPSLAGDVKWHVARHVAPPRARLG